jgi:ABC-type Fe3+/spermidine/putrescine transport system ATPase subunit
VVIEPELLLLDEPLSNLDLKLREEMRSEIRGLQRALGITTIFVTHDQDEALSMADEIVVMKDGRIVQVGTPTGLYERPACRFVAHFIGESNLESGKVDALAGPGMVRVDAAGLTVVASAAAPWSPGDPVAIAVRPERVRLGAAPPVPGDVNAFAGTIAECIFRGATRRYRVRLPHGHVWSVDEPAQAGMPLSPGASVSVAWRAEDCLAIPDT